MFRIDVSQEVATLGDLSRVELATLWQRAFGCLPPSGVRRSLLLRAAAWHHQARRLGGLSPSTSKLLRQAVADAEEQLLRRSKLAAANDELVESKDEVDARRKDRPRERRVVPRPGARLIREWNGHTYVVDVLEEGFAFEGKVHRSLSVIARLITGTQWSGPRFFGL